MEINLNRDTIIAKLAHNNYADLCEILKEEFKIRKHEETQRPSMQSPTVQSLEILGTIIEVTMQNVRNQISVNESVELMRRCFICLRNSATTGRSTQNSIVAQFAIMNSCEQILYSFPGVQEYEGCLIMVLQFLGNVIVDNARAQQIIWDNFVDYFIPLLHPTPSPTITAVTMILYNIYRAHRDLLPNDLSFSEIIIELYGKGDEFAKFILELLVMSKSFITLYIELNPEQKIILFDIIHEMILSVHMPEEFLRLLSMEFKQKSDCILKTVGDYVNRVEPLEVKGLLDVLATASGVHTYLPVLQSDKSLLINCIYLLKSIHSLGKMSENDFSSVLKLSELTHINGKESTLQDHPAFGFKAQLVRILGNMSYMHAENQKEIRELECIQLLLDCCNIDARNPLIIQWVTLAIRNLCENNPENQAIIAATTKVGTVDSATLREMGVILNENDKNEVGIVPLNTME